MRIFYVDDSGDERLTTFSAIGMPAERWARGLEVWLGWRRHLHDEHAVPLRRRLHAVDWVTGRGRPSEGAHAPINRRKAIRWAEYVAALETVAAIPDVSVHTAALAGADRRGAYRILMRALERDLEQESDTGLVLVDGEGDELWEMHRELDLASRAIVEDPWKRAARESPLLQAADFVAYAAFQGMARKSERAFMWHWYEQCLADCIAGG